MRALVVALLLPSLALAQGYRKEPFSDVEIEDMKSAVSEVYPGAFTTIGGASLVCACEEGPTCSSQSQVSVTHQGKNFGLSLSRIDGRWVVGKMQSWELKRKAFKACYYPGNKASPEAVQAFKSCRLAEHNLMASKPTCRAPEKP
jgi:hypothetical protein